MSGCPYEERYRHGWEGARIDFSGDGDLIAGTKEGFAFPRREDALCSRAVPVVQRRCSCSPVFEIAAVLRHTKF